MREIKFRAYDNVLKIMMPDFDNWLDFNGNYWTSPDKCYDTPNQEIVRGHNYIIMQFTGLHDKNGKEIYEGDIITDSDIIMRVKWFDKFSCFCLVSSDWVFPHFFGEASDPDNCEVIGNIYQNPDLLK